MEIEIHISYYNAITYAHNAGNSEQIITRFGCIHLGLQKPNMLAAHLPSF
jgi:hypothetical protein